MNVQTLEEFLEGQDWFSASENPSLADLSILANFAIVHHLGLEINNYPNLTAWYERCSILKGYNENERGAKILANIVKNKLTEPF